MRAPIIKLYDSLKSNMFNEKYLEESWNFNNHKTIAVIFANRKNGNKNSSILSLIWMKNNHNLLYRLNLMNYINNYGCWKDIFKIIEKTIDNNYEYNFVAYQLIKDKKNYENNQDISYCIKWAFSQNNKKAILLAKLLFNNSNGHLMELYRKEYLKPLRNKLNLIETKMCNNDWKSIDYSTISRKKLFKLKSVFIRHDKERYLNYIMNIANNNIHKSEFEYLANYYFHNNHINEEVESRWVKYINEIKYENTLSNMIAVIDTSSLNPIIIGIGLLIANCNDKKIIIFSKNPYIYNLKKEESNKLYEQINYIKSLDNDIIINYEKLYGLIMNDNNQSKITLISDKDIKKSSNSTDFFINKRDFELNNSKIPKVIYWNITNNNEPFNDYYNDITLLNGFCNYSLKSFIKYNDISIEKIIDEKLKVYYKDIIF